MPDALASLAAAPQLAKTYHRGTHRCAPPAQTVARFRPKLLQMGITRVGTLTGLDRIGVPVVMVCRPNARSIAVSQGKGLDQDSALASGIMEAAEIHHAEHVDRPLRRTGRRQLARKHGVIATDRLPRMAGSSFHDDMPILWIEGVDIVSGEPRWLPFETVAADYTLPRPAGCGCFDSSTNGLASGNHALEAVCHGICEAIERDATTLWNRRGRDGQAETRIAPDSVTDPLLRPLIDRIEGADFEIGVWDTTSDIGVASFFCVIVDRNERPSHVGVGAGCHPSRDVALARALTEAVQVRTTYISGARDDLLPAEYGRKVLAGRYTWASRLLVQTAPERPIEAVPDHRSETINGDVRALLKGLAQAGMDEVVCVDLTRDDIGLPVVRTVIPGLEGPDDHDGYVPGRRANAVARALT